MDYEKLADLLFEKDLKSTEYYEKLYSRRNLKEGAIVTRCAPSPTGRIHIGNLYSYFISEAFAHQSGGIFFLRVEDTDKKRAIENGVQSILDDLKEYNFKIDEGPEIGGDYGPYIQSERKDIYRSFAKSLVLKGLAYPCFCSEDVLEEIRFSQERSKKRIGYYGKYARCRNLTLEEIEEKLKNKEDFVIRLKSPGNFENKVILDDLIKGKIEMPENDLDVVILKSDGIPTYHFAHAVDDYLMGTTVVTRGDEWVSSYPIHDQLFKVLGFSLPKFAHIAPLTKKEGENVIRKLSKRKDNEAKISYYSEKGIPDVAVKLYLATIANPDFERWYTENPDKSYSDFKFEFDKMSVGGSLFDVIKLQSISKIYFSRLKAKDLYEEALKYFKKYNNEFASIMEKYDAYTINVLNIERETLRPRKDIDSYSSIYEIISYMYDELFDKEYKGVDIKEFYEIELLKDYITNYFDENDTKDEWFSKIKLLCDKHGFASDNKEFKASPERFKGNISNVCEVIRVMATGRVQSPDLYEILKLLGKKRINDRIGYFEKYLGENK